MISMVYLDIYRKSRYIIHTVLHALSQTRQGYFETAVLGPSIHIHVSDPIYLLYLSDSISWH